MDSFCMIPTTKISMISVDLSIIIVNWNSKDYLQNCIASILANTIGIGYEIIVVDSASFDGCAEMLRDTYPQVHFIQSERNIGFAGANNIGSQHAHGDVLLFLNPDTEVQANAIQHLYFSLCKLPQAGIVGCRLLNSDRSLQTSCVMPLPTILNQVLNTEILQRAFPNYRLWMSAAKFESGVSPAPVEAVSGACMMVKRKVFDRVLGFSTDYFMYAEDLDLCYKTRAAGFINYYIVEAEIIHHGGGSTRHGRSRLSEIMIPESIRRLLIKTHSNFYSLIYRWALTGSAIIRLFLLGFSFPIGLIKNKGSQWNMAFSKWFVILRWGIGLEQWVQKLGQPKEITAGLNVGKDNQCAG